MFLVTNKNMGLCLYMTVEKRAKRMPDTTVETTYSLPLPRDTNWNLELT